jgi:drug/metabolite transporter (DMT)-like permease
MPSGSTPGFEISFVVLSSPQTKSHVARLALAAALASAVLFGATTPIAKELLSGATPLMVAGLLYVGSGLGVSLIWLAGDRRPPAGLFRRDWMWLAAGTLAGGIVAPVLLMTGLRRLDAATASLLLNLETVFTALLAWIAFREATGPRVMTGLLAIIAGGALLAWPSRAAAPVSLVGFSLVAAACLAWALDNNLTRKVSGSDARIIAAVKGLAAGAVNTSLALSLGDRLPAPSHVAALLMLGFVGYGLSLVLFVVALRHLGSARTGAYFATAPFVGTAIAILLFGQPVTGVFWGAAALMAIGVWLHLSERHDHEHRHEPITHSHPHVHDAHHRHAHETGWNGDEPHAHEHRHEPLLHRHPHFPDIHHRHGHG